MKTETLVYSLVQFIRCPYFVVEISVFKRFNTKNLRLVVTLKNSQFSFKVGNYLVEESILR